VAGIEVLSQPCLVIFQPGQFTLQAMMSLKGFILAQEVLGVIFEIITLYIM
jgi:hypothetical protein